MDYREMIEQVMKQVREDDNPEYSRAYAMDVRNNIIPSRERIINDHYTKRVYGTGMICYGD